MIEIKKHEIPCLWCSGCGEQDCHYTLIFQNESKFHSETIKLCLPCLTELSNQLNRFMAELNKADKLPEDADDYCETCQRLGDGGCQGGYNMPCDSYSYCGTGANYEAVQE